MAATRKTAVESVRDIVQDILVPDMKAIRTEVESHHRESKTEFESVRNAINALADSLRTEMKLRAEKQEQSVQAISDKLGYTVEIRERLAVLEDRTSRPT